MIIAIGYPLGWVTQEITLSAIVGLLTLFITSEILERRLRFEKIEKLLINGFDKTIATFGDANVEYFDGEDDFFKYLIAKLPQVEHSIKFTSLGPSHGHISATAQKFYKEKAKLIAAGKIRYNYLTVINNQGRLDRIIKDLHEANDKKYFVGYFDENAMSIPMVSFTVLDDKELIIGGHRTLYAPSEGTASILVRNEKAARLFSDYFDMLWRNAIKINEHGIIRQDIINALLEQVKNKEVKG